MTQVKEETWRGVKGRCYREGLVECDVVQEVLERWVAEGELVQREMRGEIPEELAGVVEVGPCWMVRKREWELF